MKLKLSFKLFAGFATLLSLQAIKSMEQCWWVRNKSFHWKLMIIITS